MKKGDRLERDPKKSGHDFQKVNLLTKGSGQKIHDLYRCTRCKAEGKNLGIGSPVIVIDKPANAKAMVNCKPDTSSPLENGITHVRVLNTGQSKAFDTLKQGEVYPVIDAPADYQKYRTDVWLWGNGEPVRLLEDEWTKAETPEDWEPKAPEPLSHIDELQLDLSEAGIAEALVVFGKVRPQ